MPPKYYKTPQWKSSKAKKRLAKMILEDNSIPLDPTATDYTEVFDIVKDHRDFAGKWDQEDKFERRLKSIQESLSRKITRAEDDKAALLHDRQIKPKPTHNHLGQPRWEGSAAETFLKRDLVRGKDLNISLEEFYHSRMEYEVFEYSIFTKHIDQEQQLRKLKRANEDRIAAKKKNKNDDYTDSDSS